MSEKQVPDFGFPKPSGKGMTIYSTGLFDPKKNSDDLKIGDILRYKDKNGTSSLLRCVGKGKNGACFVTA